MADVSTSPSVLIVHGPNLNLLGQREPDLYGHTTLDQLDAALDAQAQALGLRLQTLQSNHEGVLIDAIQGVTSAHHAGLVVNPGGFTHTSVAIQDALRAVSVPTIEVHLTNLYARESFRHVSVTGAACSGVIMGLGVQSYHLALGHLALLLCGSLPK